MVYFIVILVAAASRFVPHVPNFAPITALAIFSAVYLPKKQAVAVPLLARLASDFFLGFFAWQLMLAVYAAHLLGLAFGFWIKRESRGRWLRVAASSLGASALFFLVTNFAFLYPQYSHDWQGVVQAYAAGLPFFRGTLFGDLSYTFALFGAYALAQRLATHKYLAQKPL